MNAIFLVSQLSTILQFLDLLSCLQLPLQLTPFFPINRLKHQIELMRLLYSSTKMPDKKCIVPYKLTFPFFTNHKAKSESPLPKPPPQQSPAWLIISQTLTTFPQRIHTADRVSPQFHYFHKIRQPLCVGTRSQHNLPKKTQPWKRWKTINAQHTHSFQESHFVKSLY